VGQVAEGLFTARLRDQGEEPGSGGLAGGGLVLAGEGGGQQQEIFFVLLGQFSGVDSGE
jgi:hypothetical protein